MTLRRTLGMHSVQRYPHNDTVLVGFDPRDDVLSEALKYRSIAGVNHARAGGEGGWIEALWSDGN